LYTAIPQKSVCTSAVFVPKFSGSFQHLAAAKKHSVNFEKEAIVTNPPKTATKISLQKTVTTGLIFGRTPIKVNANFCGADLRNLRKDRYGENVHGSQTPKYKTKFRNRKTLRKDFPQNLPETYTLWDLVRDSLVN
jgi:hypothetical protein